MLQTKWTCLLACAPAPFNGFDGFDGFVEFDGFDGFVVSDEMDGPTRVRTGTVSLQGRLAAVTARSEELSHPRASVWSIFLQHLHALQSQVTKTAGQHYRFVSHHTLCFSLYILFLTLECGAAGQAADLKKWQEAEQLQAATEALGAMIAAGPICACVAF
jgi:hypothetical protein